MEVLKKSSSTDRVVVFKVVQYDEVSQELCGDEANCLNCGKLIPSYSFGLVTLVEEGHSWCYKCGLERLEDLDETDDGDQTELYEFMLGLVNKDDSSGC
jgi:hypothetical protein